MEEINEKELEKKIIKEKIKIAKEHQKKFLKIRIIIFSISTLIGLIILLISVSKYS
ncbi:hypothetical protein [Spiroplasma endosymbiont of Melieria omissa]|uniref:hypothetical protein n=1 Tax=Spiroplasma endosymbiont of Melieria omissa TaxID=3139324 RepID=UPI003CCB0960